MASESDELEKRVRELETKYDRLRTAGVVAGVLVLGFFGVGLTQIQRAAQDALSDYIAADRPEFLETIDGFLASAQEDVKAIEANLDQSRVGWISGTITADQWQAEGTLGVHANVEIDMTTFSNPRVFVSLSGEGCNWFSNGPAIYPFNFSDSDPGDPQKGFRIYVLLDEIEGTNGCDLDPVEVAVNGKWQVDWLVIGEKLPSLE